MPRTNNQGPSPNTHNKEKMTRMGVLGHLHTWTSSLPTREVLSDTPSFPLHAARVFQRGPGKATAIGVPRRHTTRLGLLAGLGPVCSCGPRRESKFSSNEKGKRHRRSVNHQPWDTVSWLVVDTPPTTFLQGPDTPCLQRVSECGI